MNASYKEFVKRGKQTYGLQFELQYQSFILSQITWQY